MNKLLLVVAISLGLISCNRGEFPKGKDENGFYNFKQRCVKSHERSVAIFGGRQGIRTVCDSSVTEKSYLKPENVDLEWMNEYISLISKNK